MGGLISLVVCVAAHIPQPLPFNTHSYHQHLSLLPPLQETHCRRKLPQSSEGEEMKVKGGVTNREGMDKDKRESGGVSEWRGKRNAELERRGGRQQTRGRVKPENYTSKP